MLIASVLLLPCEATAKQVKIKADLDGDGQDESIVLEIAEGEYTLRIDGRAYSSDNPEQNAQNLTVADIDKQTRFRQVLVHGELNGGYGFSDLFAYDGRRIERIQGFVGGLSISGNGKIYVDVWHGNYSTKKRHTYDEKTQTLTETPQDLYYIGMELTVKESFPVYLERAKKSSKILLRKASRISLLAVDFSTGTCDGPGGQKTEWGCEWFLIKTSTGLLGWARLNAFAFKVDGLPSAG
jgi:hypothetical protein